MFLNALTLLKVPLFKQADGFHYQSGLPMPMKGLPLPNLLFFPQFVESTICY